MSESRLFPKDAVIGIFRGFSQGGLEFHADLVMPYRPDFQSTPMHGLFLMVQLENDREAVLGRITSFFSDGRLASGTGEDYGIRAVMEDRVIPDDLREQYLKYRVNIRVLGVVRLDPKGKIVFAASHRRLPHVGSKVARLSPEVLKDLVGHNDEGAPLGHYALGEFIYAGADPKLARAEWMRVVEPAIMPRFDIRHLVSRRTFIFARAGYGKSNLNKLLFSSLYGGEEPPTIDRDKRKVPVGTVLFDPEGEYFWPDNAGRPGFCDVPGLEERLVVFTGRKPPSAFYGSFVAGPVRLDIRRLRPSDVVSIALSPEKQDQQNVAKLKGMSSDNWKRLVDAVHEHGNQTDSGLVRECLRLKDDQGSAVEVNAALSNMTRIVKMLHDPHSQLLDTLLNALKGGCLCVVDVSQLRGEAAFVLSGIILQRIFDHNQEHFTLGDGGSIPVLTVVEEAQTVLGAGHASSAMRPYVEWVKEGRKYDLGAVMVTQRPGSISDEILSQGDNWFIFHLLSARDLNALRMANAHFSDDLLSSILNEPIKGHGIFWSSESPRPFPVPVRVLEFGKLYAPRDLNRAEAAAGTWASSYRARFGLEPPVTQTVQTRDAESQAGPAAGDDGEGLPAGESAVADAEDQYTVARRSAIEALGKNEREMRKLRDEGLSWGRLKHLLVDHLPAQWQDRDQQAYELVKPFLEATFGREDEAWHVVGERGRKRVIIGPKPVTPQ